jgi:hypothetical protein
MSVERLHPVLLLVLLFSFAGGESYALEQTQPRDCGEGQLLDDGFCRDIRQVAAEDGGSVYWVDTQEGSDSNPGTEERPFATISHTTASGVLEPGDWVIIRDGIYREEIRPQESGAVVGGDTLRITWAAYPGEKVVISGADAVTTSWERQSDGAWRQDWVWGGLWNDSGASGIQRRELFVDNGTPLVPVASRSDVEPGTFYVEGGEESSTPTAVYLRTHDDTDPNSHTIEVGQRGQLFQTHGEPDHECGSSGKYYKLIGLTFRHATTHSQRGAVCPGAKGTVIERVTARENNGAGFKVIGNRHVLRDVKVLKNGRTGLSGSRAENILVDGAEIAHNNYRGYDYFDESGGGKFTRTKSSTFQRLYSHDNEGPGFWLDIRNQGNTIARSVFDRNIGYGLNLELKTRETRVVNNVFSRTRFAQRPQRGFGLSIQLSYDNLVAFNTFIMNGEGGVYTWNDGREDDPAYKPTRSRHNHIYNNLFVNNLQGPSPEENQMQLVDLDEDENVHTGFTNQVDGNAYWPTNAGKKFGALYHVRHPDGGTGNFKAESLSEWQRTTIHDQSSFTVDASEPHVENPNEAESGWRLASGSQMIGKAVPLPDKWAPVREDFEGNPRPPEAADIGADQVSSAFLAEQKISLHEGWNLISSHVQPYDSSMGEVFSDILSRVEVVRNEAGERYVPGEAENTIGAWESREAYRVYMKESGTLHLKGRELSTDTTSISLEKGWNLVPYFPDGSMPVEDALASISSALVMVKDGTGRVYLPRLTIDSIDSLYPGQGYKMYVSDPTTFTYPASADSDF